MPPSVPITQSPQPPAHFPFYYPCSFPRVRCLSCFVTLTDIFTHFLSFPFIPFHYYLYSPNEREYMFVLLRLTYFTQHNTLQFHPRQSKWWVFVVSNDSIVYIDHIFFIHSSFDGHRGSFHSLAIVDIAAINIGVQVSRRFTASVSLG